MMNLMENIDLEKIVSSLYDAYYKFYPEMPRVLIKVDFTDDLNETHFELRPDLKEQLIDQGIEQFYGDNGRMIPPHLIGEKFVILLNKNRVIEYIKDGTMTWVGTFAHELTHAIDYFVMAQKECLDNYDFLLNENDYYLFQLWSEYHAKRIGYDFLVNYFNENNEGSRQNWVQHILNKELPYQMQYFYEKYNETQNACRQMYYSLHFLGRYSVWCDMFPEVFNDSSSKKVFVNNPWMNNIRIFLNQHQNMDAIYDKFEEMRVVLKENWKTI